MFATLDAADRARAYTELFDEQSLIQQKRMSSREPSDLELASAFAKFIKCSRVRDFDTTYAAWCTARRHIGGIVTNISSTLRTQLQLVFASNCNATAIAN